MNNSIWTALVNNAKFGSKLFHHLSIIWDNIGVLKRGGLSAVRVDMILDLNDAEALGTDDLTSHHDNVGRTIVKTVVTNKHEFLLQVLPRLNDIYWISKK